MRGKAAQGVCNAKRQPRAICQRGMSREQISTARNHMTRNDIAEVALLLRLRVLHSVDLRPTYDRLVAAHSYFNLGAHAQIMSFLPQGPWVVVPNGPADKAQYLAERLPSLLACGHVGYNGYVSRCFT